MGMRPDNTLDRQMVQQLSGRDKLYALLRARGFTMASYARLRGFWPEQVKLTLYGRRPYPEVRSALAADLGLSRDLVDLAIDGHGEKIVARE
jgi:lambda repressor-like predicted transcriptional regulator